MVLRNYSKAEEYAYRSIELRGGPIKTAEQGFGDCFEFLIDSLIAQNKKEACIEICTQVLDHIHLFVLQH